MCFRCPIGWGINMSSATLEFTDEETEAQSCLPTSLWRTGKSKGCPRTRGGSIQAPSTPGAEAFAFRCFPAPSPGFLPSTALLSFIHHHGWGPSLAVGSDPRDGSSWHCDDAWAGADCCACGLPAVESGDDYVNVPDSGESADASLGEWLVVPLTHLLGKVLSPLGVGLPSL